MSREYFGIRTKPYRIVEYSVPVAPCLDLLQQETECAEECQDAHSAAVRAQLLLGCCFYNSSPPPQTSTIQCGILTPRLTHTHALPPPPTLFFLLTNVYWETICL